MTKNCILGFICTFPTFFLTFFFQNDCFSVGFDKLGYRMDIHILFSQYLFRRFLGFIEDDLTFIDDNDQYFRGID